MHRDLGEHATGYCVLEQTPFQYEFVDGKLFERLLFDLLEHRIPEFDLTRCTGQAAKRERPDHVDPDLIEDNRPDSAAESVARYLRHNGHIGYGHH